MAPPFTRHCVGKITRPKTSERAFKTKLHDVAEAEAKNLQVVTDAEEMKSAVNFKSRQDLYAAEKPIKTSATVSKQASKPVKLMRKRSRHNARDVQRA